MNGVIKKKMEGKDFGFISVEGQEKDVFFHKSEVTDASGFEGLSEGDKVTFDTKQDAQGRTNATNVQKAA
jgi:CspA family cold shock protein